jgi:hypothetical protein
MEQDAGIVADSHRGVLQHLQIVRVEQPGRIAMPLIKHVLERANAHGTGVAR